MVVHTCPICARRHAVREARASVAYGRQFTCSPECESERRWRRRHHVAQPVVSAVVPATSVWPTSILRRLRAAAASSLHVWTIGTAGADLVRTAGWMRSGDPFR